MNNNQTNQNQKLNQTQNNSNLNQNNITHQDSLRPRVNTNNTFNSQLNNNQVNRINNNFEFNRQINQDNNLLNNQSNQLNSLNTKNNNLNTKNPTNQVSSRPNLSSSLPRKKKNSLLPKGNLKPQDGLKNKANIGDKTLNQDVPKALQSNGKIPNLRNHINNHFSSDTNQDNSDNLDNETNYEDEELTTEPTISETKRKYAFLIKLLPILLPVALGLIIVLMVVVMFSNPLTLAESFFSFYYHNTDQASYLYNSSNPEMSEDEKKYNDKLAEKVSEYRSNYGVSLDKFLLHATIVYPYYSGSFNENGDFEVYIDYDDAIKRLESVASLMIQYNSNGTYSTDKKKNGIFYTNLVNSDFLTSYYKDYLKDTTQESKEKLVDEIFDFAELAREIVVVNNSSFISDKYQVFLQTCDLPYKYKEINGIKVWDNPSATGDYPESLALSNYLKGVIYGEIGNHLQEDKKEAIKAMVIAALTFTIKHEASGFDLQTGEMYMPAGNCKQLCCDPDNGCTYKYNSYEFNGTKYGTSYSGPYRFSGAAFNRQPMSEEQHAFMDEIISEVFGIIMVKKGVTTQTFVGSQSIASEAGNYLHECSAGTCFSQEDAMQDALNGMNYVDILNKYYFNVDNGNGFDLINIKEGLYLDSSISGDYNGSYTTTEQYHYYQTIGPWANQNLCGSGPISANGCNITSAAIAISLLTNQEVTPSTLNNRQNEIRTCSASSRPQMIMDFAKLYGLTPTEVLKDDTEAVNDMLEKIASGNYIAIARIAPNSGRYYTTQGHFIVLVGVKNENGTLRTLVWDPYKPNPNRDNYWADFNNDILKCVRDSYSFILIGSNGL